MTASTPFFAFVGAIKVDPGPIPELNPPRKEIIADLPDKAILVTVIFLAFSVLILGRVFRRPKLIVPAPPEHPAAAARRVLSHIAPDASPALAAEAASHAVRDYLRTAYGLGVEELTTLEISERFGAHRLADSDTVARVLGFLRVCEAAQFTPPGEVQQAAITEPAWRLIDELERHRAPVASTPPPLPVAT
jgi:hypothetical protein